MLQTAGPKEKAKSSPEKTDSKEKRSGKSSPKRKRFVRKIDQ